jgi:hypothetical protein
MSTGDARQRRGIGAEGLDRLFASLRTIRLPSRDLQLRPRAKPRKVSSASIQVSIISTSTHEAVVADEIEFLHRHLLGRSLCGTTKAASELPRVYLPGLTSSENPVGEGVATATSSAGISQIKITKP